MNNKEVKKIGRPVNENSVRQAKLKVKQELLEQGVEIKRGRPVNVESDRQKRLELKGKVKLGRKVDMNSARQQRLQALEMKKASGVEVKRGRPKMKVEEDVVE
jgi:hypothetical protein